MKSLSIICLFLFSAMFYACNQPAPTQPSFSGKMALIGYGEAFDSSYYKVWSDSTWEQFNGDTTIGGSTYTILLASDSSEYFYDSSGNYSGFELPQLYGNNIIIFDTALASLPDTMVGNLTYQQLAAFSFQGSKYTLIDNETLVDSGTVFTAFGTFTNCPAVQSYQTIVAGSNVVAGSSVVYWLAKGPSVVEQDFYDYFYGYLTYTITMAYGVVNGQGWGVGSSKEQLVNHFSDKAGTQQSPMVATKKSVADIKSIAPMILKGIRRAPSKSVRW